MILLCRHQNGHCGGWTVTGETKKDAETRTRDYRCHSGSSLGLNSRKTSTFAEFETSPVSRNFPLVLSNGHHNSYFFRLEQLLMFVVVFRYVILFYCSSCRFTTMILLFFNNYTASLQCAFYLSWAETHISCVFPETYCDWNDVILQLPGH